MTRKLKVRTKKDRIEFKGSKKKHLCLMMSTNKGIELLWISENKREFKFRNNHYFIVPEATYISINNIRVSMFMEGISTPLSHKNIETVLKDVEIENQAGKKTKRKVSFIKGLKYDSKLIDMLLHKGLFKEFLTNYFDLQGLVMLIMIAVITVLGVINTIMLYVGLFNGG